LKTSIRVLETGILWLSVSLMIALHQPTHHLCGE